MKHIISVAILASALGAACEPEETVADAPTEPTSEAPPETTTTLAPEPAVPGITPRVKTELDKRVDGASGSRWSVARATMQIPAAWSTVREAGVERAKDETGKVELAALGDTTKLEDAVNALGLTECRWAPSESVTLGTDELSASAADGLCKKGGVEVPAAQLIVPDASLLMVGAWESGGDDAGLFATMRSVAGVTKNASGGGGISACCAALAQNRVSAPPEQQGAYDAALGICRTLQSNPEARKMVGQVQAALRGANVPAACR